MSLFQKLLRAGEGKKLKLLESIVPDVAAFEPEISGLSDSQLAAKTDDFRQRLASLRKELEVLQKKTPHQRRFVSTRCRCQSQYTTMYRPSHTTSTKCQYHAAPSKPK